MSSRELWPDILTLPDTIFCKELSALESVVKYLRENKRLTFSTMQDLLKRDHRVLAITYHRARTKHSEQFSERGRKIPVSIFSKKLSVPESVAVFFKVTYRMSYQEIADVMKKDYQTVRTMYKRGMKKLS